MKVPPRLARALMRALAPSALKDEVAGDLDEVWGRGDTNRLLYWRLAAGSIVALWIHAQRTRGTRAQVAHPREDGLMSALVQDLAYGVRQMRRAPGFTLAAVLTLALGIGVNAATFSIVNVLSLKSLPYGDPERVAFVMGWDAQRRDLRMNLPRADLADITTQARSFQRVAAYDYWSANLTGSESPERVQAYRVTGNTFALLGVSSVIGRVLTEGDVRGEPGRPTDVRRGGGHPVGGRRAGLLPARPPGHARRSHRGLAGGMRRSGR